MHSVPINGSSSGGLDAVALFEDDFEAAVQQLIAEIAELYLSDAIPWVVGYSGGKDSTATLQLVWMALERLGAEQRTKPVHVISTDTLVENPIVAAWVGRSLGRMNEAAKSAGASDFFPSAYSGGARHLLGEPHRPRLPRPATQVSLVHGAAQDPALASVHQGDGRPARRRPSSCSAPARRRAQPARR